MPLVPQEEGSDTGVHSQDPGEVLQAALELVVCQVGPGQGGHPLLSPGGLCHPLLNTGQECCTQTLQGGQTDKTKGEKVTFVIHFALEILAKFSGR